VNQSTTTSNGKGDSTVPVMTASYRRFPEVMTKEQAADFLGVEWRTLQAWCQSRGTPHVYIGRVLRFIKADLINWLRSMSTTEPAGRVPSWSKNEPAN
jgi:excisionase family DNA binding protein